MMEKKYSADVVESIIVIKRNYGSIVKVPMQPGGEHVLAPEDDAYSYESVPASD